MSKLTLIGDSITQYMPYFYKGRVGLNGDEIEYCGVENIGVGSYRNYIWPNVKQKDVDIYILLIGTNNISRPDCDYDNRETLEDLIDKLKEFIGEITTSTSARLIVQSIYPTKYFERNQNIIKVNKQIEIYCKEIGVEYLDLYPLLEDEAGVFSKEYSDDGIHPNSDGYHVIANEINKKLAEKILQKQIKKTAKK